MPDQITANPDPTYAYVVLRVEYTATASATATVERSADGGATWTAVRGGNPLTLVGPAPGAGSRIGYLVDAEAPLDATLYYRATSNLGTLVTTGPWSVSSSGLGWLKDPARPWANLSFNGDANDSSPWQCADPPVEPAITLVGGGLGAQAYEGDFNLFPILNRRRPADVWAYRKDAVTSWRVVSKTLVARNSLDVFYAWGGPIFLQMPAVYGWPDRYYQPGRVEESRLTPDLRNPRRFWDAPLTVVDMQPGAAQGTAVNNWCLIKSTYHTWADFTATGLTWGDVMAGAAAPPPVDGYGGGLYGDGPYGDGG